MSIFQQLTLLRLAKTGLEQIEETHSLSLIKMIVGHRWLLVSEVCREPQNTRTASDILLCLQVVHLDVEITIHSHNSDTSKP
jgi:hypothetical protein